MNECIVMMKNAPDFEPLAAIKAILEDSEDEEEEVETPEAPEMMI